MLFRNQTIPWPAALGALLYVAQYALELAEVFPLNSKRRRRRRRRDDEDEGVYGQVGRCTARLITGRHFSSESGL